MSRNKEYCTKTCVTFPARCKFCKKQKYLKNKRIQEKLIVKNDRFDKFMDDTKLSVNIP